MDYEDLFKLKPVLDYDVSNNDKLAYISLENKPTLYVEGSRVEMPYEPDEVKWNESRIIVSVDKEGSERRSIYLYDGGKIDKILEDEHDNFNPTFVKEGLLFISNRDGKTLHLYFYDDKSIVKLSKGEEPVESYCVLNDELIVYSQGIYDNDVNVINLNGDIITKISYRDSEQLVLEQCKYKDGFLFLSNHTNYYSLYYYDLKRGEASLLAEENEAEIYEAVPYNPLAYVYLKEGRSYLKINERVIEGGFIHSLKTTNSSLYFIMSTYDREDDVYKYDGNVKRLTDSMSGISGEFVKPTPIYYESQGVRIHAFLYSRGREDKGVVYIHGGPDWLCSDWFNPTIQLLVNKGFKVICPNYRGSIGFGRKFNHLNDKDLGGGDLIDVISSAKILGTKKVAITGGSYGGYLTMMAITKFPENWCSAVAIVPFVNWFTEKQFEREVLKQYDEVKIGNDEKLLKERSPIFFIQNVKAPLLILAGENDPRCPAEETLQVVEELKRLGREVKYKIYKGEGHGFVKRENYADSIKETVEFIVNNCK
ncbi:MAG: S9 family peptidase [Sulfolobus sp.]